MKKIFCFICLTIIFFLVRGAIADNAPTAERGTKEEAVALVERGVEYFKAVGSEKAFAAFSNTKGKFIDRDLYILAYDSTGTCLAHGYNNKLIGINRANEQDADGIYFVKERIELMKTQTKFWTHYKFADPLTRKILPKSLYCEVVNDPVLKNLLICAGIYDAKP